MNDRINFWWNYRKKEFDPKAGLITTDEEAIAYIPACAEGFYIKFRRAGRSVSESLKLVYELIF